MYLILEGDRFVFRCSFEERGTAKDAGFRWDPGHKHWYTKDPVLASRFYDLADPTCRQALECAKQEVDLSRQSSADVEIPKPDGLNYLPFQKAGIQYALRHPAVIIADEMGLGKTIQALGVVNAKGYRKVLVVCPASLKLNWANEARKWLLRSPSIMVLDSKSMLSEAVNAEVCIINYDIVKNGTLDSLKNMGWECIILDESHYLKNPKAHRTKNILGYHDKTIHADVDGLVHRCKHKIFLTGTPILNRPIEIQPVLSAIDKDTWGNWFKFGLRYADGKRTRFGWDFSGASHLEELQTRLRATCMVRRLKKDVLSELPAKRRMIIEVPANGSRQLVAQENLAFSAHESKLDRLRQEVELAYQSGNKQKYKAMVEELRDACNVAFTEISELRHQTALAKIPAVLAHIEDMLELTEKIVVFAHHRDVINQIVESFEGAVKLTGDTGIIGRQEAVEKFQTDPTCRVFVGSIKAAGLGITLTASSTVVFVELDWVPASISQAEDRCHRIGQQEQVLVQHLVIDGSLDARLAKTLVEKQEIIDRALDLPVDVALPGR